MGKAAIKKNSPIPPDSLHVQVLRALVGLMHVVCPLLFFTNLTRNPYFSQIALLNISISICGLIWVFDCWRRGELKWPRLPFELPLLAFLVIALTGSALSWFHHESLRPGIFSEGTRIWVFTLLNCVFALFLPAFVTSPISGKTRPLSIWTDIVLAMVWGAMWFGFHEMKDPTPSSGLWDFYGGFLWFLGGVYAILRTKRGESIEMFHVIFVVGFLAGLYGIMQYCGRDMIWASPIQPYGGRPVSTFGNPNFLSSYLMMISPLAFSFGLRSTGRQMLGYFVVAFVTALGALCTLTRSTYLGFLAAYASLGLLVLKRENMGVIKKVAIGTLVFIILILIFPHTPLLKVQSPLARFTEIYTAYKTGESYGPWDQRLLIWSCAWEMAKSHLLFGKGWGCFELFYPFYQGHFILIERLAQWRTHANNAHNILLEIWSQTGFLGTGAALWLLVTMLWGGILLYRRQRESAKGVVIAGLLAGIVGMIVDNFFGNVSIFFAVPAFLFWWGAGTLFNESDISLVETTQTRGWQFYVCLALVSGISIFGGLYFVKRWKQEVLYFEGFKQAKSGQVGPSYKSLEKAVAWFSGEVNTNYELGNSYSRTAHELASKGLAAESRKFNEKAAEAYDLALKANPGYDEIYFNLGITLNQLGRQEEGLKALQMAVFINPLLRDAYGSTGNILINRGELEKASRVFEQAVSMFPGDKDFWNNLGFTYSQMKEDGKSFEAYKKALLIDPGFQQAWHNFAIASRTLGRQDPLLEIPVLIKDMESSVAQKNFKAALRPASRIVELLPDHADSHLSLGNIYFYLNEYAKSETEYQRTIKLKPQFTIAHTNLGRLYQVQGKLVLARQSFQKALDVDPNNTEAKQALAEVSGR